MATSNVGILWFRRDLRLHDHPALVVAARDHATLVPLFVVDPALVGGRFASANRVWFMLESVRALRSSLRDLDSDLVVRVGDPRVVVPEISRQVDATAVHVSRDHAPYGRDRDRAVAAELASHGVAWHGHRGVLVHEPDEVASRSGGSFTVYTPFRRAWEAVPRRPVHGPPASIPATPSGGIAAGSIPTLAALGLGDRPSAELSRLPEPGEAAARRRLDRWLTDGVEGYASTRDRLDLVDGTSRSSAYLHLGLLSPLEVVERASGDGEGRRVFRNELAWREFYAHVLFHRPELRSAALRREFDALPWSRDEADIDAWRTGRTGYPTVDAGMRQLAAEGWMPNRARMVTASFLTKHLLVDWRVGERHFMQHLVDGDVASNNGGWQWSASTGTDPQPFFRIFNPVLQGRRFDPSGDYVRRWLPELAMVPTTRIHEPWTMTPTEQVAADCRIGRDYPTPIVDHAEARARALAVYEAARRTS